MLTLHVRADPDRRGRRARRRRLERRAASASRDPRADAGSSPRTRPSCTRSSSACASSPTCPSRRWCSTGARCPTAGSSARPAAATGCTLLRAFSTCSTVRARGRDGPRARARRQSRRGRDDRRRRPWGEALLSGGLRPSPGTAGRYSPGRPRSPRRSAGSARSEPAGLSRYREFAADAGAVAITGNPAALASALMKVSDGPGRYAARRSARRLPARRVPPLARRAREGVTACRPRTRRCGPASSASSASSGRCSTANLRGCPRLAPLPAPGAPPSPHAAGRGPALQTAERAQEGRRPGPRATGARHRACGRARSSAAARRFWLRATPSHCRQRAAGGYARGDPRPPGRDRRGRDRFGQDDAAAEDLPRMGRGVRGTIGTRSRGGSPRAPSRRASRTS